MPFGSFWKIACAPNCIERNLCDLYTYAGATHYAHFHNNGLLSSHSLVIATILYFIYMSNHMQGNRPVFCGTRYPTWILVYFLTLYISLFVFCCMFFLLNGLLTYSNTHKIGCVWVVGVDKSTWKIFKLLIKLQSYDCLCADFETK